MIACFELKQKLNDAAEAPVRYDTFEKNVDNVVYINDKSKNLRRRKPRHRPLSQALLKFRRILSLCWHALAV